MTFSMEAVGKTINGLIDVIQLALPFIPQTAAATPIINKVVDTLQDNAPIIIDQISVTYTGVKNIIENLMNRAGTTEEQMAKLKAFDKQVDDAWDAIEGELDPDAPGAA